MAESFDPYYTWLGIPPKDQPPHHYRLLAIELFEANADVIDNAANRQMAHLRTFQSGKHAAESQRLLNEISAARGCLLSAEKKAAYDAQLKPAPAAGDAKILRAKPLPVAAPSVAPPPVAPPSVTAPLVVPMSAPIMAELLPAAPPQLDFLHRPPLRPVIKPTAKPPLVIQPLMLAGLLGGVGVLLLSFVVAAWFLSSGRATDKVAQNRKQNQKQAPTSFPMPIDGKQPGETPKAAGETPPALSPTRPPQVTPPDSSNENPFIPFANAPVNGNPPTELPTRPAVPVQVVSGPRPATAAPRQAAVGEAYALALDGRNQHVELLNTKDVPLLSQPLTAEAWLRVPSYSTQQFFFGDWVTAGNYPGLSLATHAGWYAAAKEAPNGQIEYQLAYRTSDVTTAKGMKVLGPKFDRDFFHFAACLTQTGTRVETSLYVNGMQVGTQSRLARAPLVSSPRNLFLGCSPYSATENQFSGEIRAFRLSSAVRYNGNFAPPPVLTKDAATLVLLDFSQGDVDRLNDVSSFGHDGLINGGRWTVVKDVAPATQVAVAPAAVVPAVATSPATTPVPVEPVARLPLPAASAQADALKQVKEQLKLEYDRAKSIDGRLALANLLSKLGEEEKDPALRYVTLAETRELASHAGDLNLALSAIDKLEKWFEADALGMKAETIRRFTVETKSPEIKRRLAELNLDLAMQAAQAHRYKEAREALTSVQNLARAVKDLELGKTAQQREKQVKTEELQWTLVETAKKTLADSPDDPKANQVVGQYLCFIRGEWETGLPHLTMGNDTTLADLAKKDLENPAEESAQTQIGDGWYELGQKSQDPQKNGALSRAQSWYGKAQPRLAGLVKAKVDKRLEELASVVTTINSSATGGARYPWLTGAPGPVQTLAGHRNDIGGLDVSRSGRLLASSSHDGTVRLWDLTSLKELHEIKLQNANRDRGVVITPDEKYVIAPAADDTVGVWKVDNGQPQTAIKSARSPCDVKISSDGRKLLWNINYGNRPNIFMWNVAANRALGQIQCTGAVQTFDMTDDGKQIVTAESNNLVQVWDVATGKVLHRLTGHGNTPVSVAVTPDGRLAASSDFNEVRIWDLKTGKSLHTFTHQNPRGVSFSLDGRRLAVGGFWDELVVYDVEKGSQLFRQRAPNGTRNITRTAFTTDSRGVVTGSSDGTIRLWRLPD